MKNILWQRNHTLGSAAMLRRSEASRRPPPRHDIHDSHKAKSTNTSVCALLYALLCVSSISLYIGQNAQPGTHTSARGWHTSGTPQVEPLKWTLTNTPLLSLLLYHLYIYHCIYIYEHTYIHKWVRGASHRTLVKGSSHGPPAHGSAEGYVPRVSGFDRFRAT